MSGVFSVVSGGRSLVRVGGGDRGVARSPFEELVREALGAGAVASRQVEKGAHLVWSEQVCDRIYLLQRGWLCLYQMFRSGRRQIVDFAIHDGVVGLEWRAGAPANYSAQALTDCQVIAVDRGAFLGAAARSPQLGLEVTLRASATAAQVSQRLANLCGRSATSRVAYALLDLFIHIRFRTPVESGEEIVLPLTQEDLADALGLTVVHVNRTLRTLREAGVVSFRGGRLRVLDPDQLADIAEYEPACLEP